MSVQAAALTFAPVASWWRWSDWSSPPGGRSYRSSSSSHHQMPGKKELPNKVILAVIISNFDGKRTQFSALSFTKLPRKRSQLCASVSHTVDMQTVWIFSLSGICTCIFWYISTLMALTSSSWCLSPISVSCWSKKVLITSCPCPPKSLWFHWQLFH